MGAQHRPLQYTAKAVTEDGRLIDVRIEWPDGREALLAGGRGVERELELVGKMDVAGVLPVVFGSGLGAAVQELLDGGVEALAVVDKEAPVTALTGCRERFAADPRVAWIDAHDPAEAVAQLSKWQLRMGGRRFKPVVLPLYMRLDRAYYHPIVQQVSASHRADFWSRARYAKFKGAVPRVLLLTSDYFLMGEIQAACSRMSVPHRLLNIGGQETGRTEFVELLLQSVLEFRPDFVFTVNHLGVDREGILVELLERLELPLASWFVDNPHLILYLYERLSSPMTAIFTWDRDNVASLRELGFETVAYLPLGTDATRFTPQRSGTDLSPSLKADVTFVGNSMVYKVAARMRAGRFPSLLLKGYREVAAGFGASGQRSVNRYLADHHPRRHAIFQGLATIEQRLAYETMITWEATRQYRLACVRRTLDFSPLIVGDRGWHVLLRHEKRPWRWHKELNYYSDLPRFYPRSAINFNCTSMQMKGAVNQRVFDVPACGAFVLTDHRDQMDELFEPGKEVVAYGHPDEIPELLAYYLTHRNQREGIVQAARERVLGCHTYEHRLEQIFSTMAATFS